MTRRGGLREEGGVLLTSRLQGGLWILLGDGKPWRTVSRGLFFREHGWCGERSGRWEPLCVEALGTAVIQASATETLAGTSVVAVESR